jgi:mRNA interferase RelE/StbE
LAYKITFKKSVHKDLNRLSKSEAKRILNKIDEELSKKADSFPVLKGKFKGIRKFRVGNYRIIYNLLENEVLILRIGHRKDVY